MQRIHLPLLDARRGDGDASLYFVVAWYAENGRIESRSGTGKAPPFAPGGTSSQFDFQVLVSENALDHVEAAIVQHVDTHGKLQYRLAVLRSAVAAQLAYWEAYRMLEIELGFREDTPNKVVEAIEQHIALLAGAQNDPPDLSQIDESHLNDLLRQLKL